MQISATSAFDFLSEIGLSLSHYWKYIADASDSRAVLKIRQISTVYSLEKDSGVYYQSPEQGTQLLYPECKDYLP